MLGNHEFLLSLVSLKFLTALYNATSFKGDLTHVFGKFELYVFTLKMFLNSVTQTGE